MREAGDVCYADVQKDGMGVVEFLRKEDMEYALRKLDDTKFRSHEVGPGLWVKSMRRGPVAEECALTCPQGSTRAQPGPGLSEGSSS